MSFHPSIYGSLYARNSDMTVSGVSQFQGDINVESDRIIYINGNTLHTFNKTRRSVYTIENQRVAIPFSIEGSSSVNIAQIYFCSLTRNDGIFDEADTNPILSFYLICSPSSVMPPIPIIQNQISSYVYDATNQQIIIEFEKNYELEVMFSMTQIQ